MIDKFTIYFIKKILVLLFVYTMIFIFIFILIDFVVQLKAPSVLGVTKFDLLELSFYKTSGFLMFLLPVICTLTMMQLFYKLAKSGQLETLQSFGLSPLRLAIKVASSYLIITFALILLIATINPIFEKKVYDLEIKFFGSHFISHSNLNKYWLEVLKEDQTRLISFKHFNTEAKELYDVEIISFDNEFTFSELITVDKLEYIGNHDEDKHNSKESNHRWFAKALSYKKTTNSDFLSDNSGELNNQLKLKNDNLSPLILEMDLTFDQISSELVFPDLLSLTELFGRIINQNKYLKDQVLSYKIRLARILSIPLYLFGIVFFICYFFLRFSRNINSRNYYIGITISIIIAQVLFFLSNILKAYIISADLHIFFGIFLTPIIFGLIALLFLISLEIDILTLVKTYFRKATFNKTKKNFFLILTIFSLIGIFNLLGIKKARAQDNSTNIIKSNSINDIIINKFEIDQDDDFELFADKFDISTETRIISAKGNIISKIGSINIKSNLAQYDQDKDFITFSENVIIELEAESLEPIEILAENLSFDRKANIIAAKGILFVKDRLTIQAEELVTDHKGWIVLNDSLATFCNYCADAAIKWRVKSKKTIFDDKDKRIKFYDGVYFQLNITPVFFSKYFSIPYPNVARASGLLVPRLGYTSSELLFFYQPYYHVIDDNSDVTITPLLSMTSYLSTLIEYRNFTKNYELKITNYVGINKGDESYSKNQKLNPNFATIVNHYQKLANNWSSNLNLHFTNNRKPIKELEIFNIDSDIFNNQLKFNGIYTNQMLTTEITATQDLTLQNHSIEHAKLPRINYNAWVKFENNLGFIDYNFDFSYLKIGLNNYYEVYEDNLAIYNSLSYNLPFSYKAFKSKFNLYLKSGIFFSSYVKKDQNYVKSSYEVGLGQELSYAFIIPSSNFANLIEPKMKVEASYSNGGTLEYAELIHEDLQTNKNNIFSNSYYISNGVLNKGVRIKYGFDYSLFGINSTDKFNFFIGHSWSFYNQVSQISNNAFVLEAGYYGRDITFSMKTNLWLDKKKPLLFFHVDLQLKNFYLGYRREYFAKNKDYLNQMVVGYSHKFDRLLLGVENVVSLDKVKLLDIELKLGYQNECLEFSLNFGKDFKVNDMTKGYKILTNFQLLF